MPELRSQMHKASEKVCMSPEAVARAVVYVLQHPEE